jgi:hypothetical protein
MKRDIWLSKGYFETFIWSEKPRFPDFYVKTLAINREKPKFGETTSNVLLRASQYLGSRRQNLYLSLNMRDNYIKMSTTEFSSSREREDDP